MRPRAKVARDILSIGMVPAFVQIATVATLILANNLVVKYGGDEGVAVMGIASSLVNLMLMPIIGVNTGIQPIIGFNYGAKLYERAKKTLWLSVGAICVICSVAYAFFWIFSAQMIGLFVRGAPEVVRLGVQSLRIYLSSMPIVGIVMLGTGYFQAVKKPMPALVPNMIRQLALLVPLYVVLPMFFGLAGVWMAGPISDAAAVIVTLVFLLPEMRKLSVKADGASLAAPAIAIE